MARSLLVLVLFATMAASTPSRASPSDPKGEAERHFRIGLDLVKEQAWDAALAEFSRSRTLLPTAGAIENAAVCLRELGRFDQALATYEELRGPVGSSLSAEERRAVDTDVARLERFVGSLVVESEPAGAAVFVDARLRGTTPLEKPVTVTVGTRTVRVTKEGYAPFERNITVASGESAPLRARLEVVSRLGRLHVTERADGRCQVFVDGVVVGTTPWDGRLAAGPHTVSLRCEHDVGTQPSEVDVATGEVRDVALVAGPLSGELRVEPTPSEAHVFVDGREVARGSWHGELPGGEHQVVVSADWYETQQMSVLLTSRGAQALRPVLRPLPRLYFDLWGGPAIAQTTALRPTCGLGCGGSVVGVSTGYEATPRLGVELYLFTLSADKSTTRGLFVSSITGDLSTSAYAQYADVISYSGGGAIRYSFFDTWPLTLRLFAGMTRGFQTTDSAGIFAGGGSSSAEGHSPYTQNFWTPLVGPELRFGYRLDAGITFDVGVALWLFLVPSTPSDRNPSANDPTVLLPAGPSFQGGVGCAVPLTAGLHIEL